MRLLTVAVVAALSAGGANVRQLAEKPAVIEPHRLGVVQIGSSADDLYQSLPPDRRSLVDLGYEGHLTPALRVSLPGATRQLSVDAELGCGRGLVVSRIFTRDPAFRTAKGIGVGSTVGELRAAYELGSLGSGEYEWGVTVPELFATFGLDQAATDFARIQQPTEIPPGVKIVSVLLWR